MPSSTIDRRRATLAVAACLALVPFACGHADGDETAPRREGLAHPGPWKIPPDTLAIGDTQYVDYTGAGPWPGSCAGDITPGAQIIRQYLLDHFPQITSIGGYSCRSINGDPTRMSVHGTGRALDVFIPLDGGEADNDLGDPVGNWIIENAEAMGIQYVIWDLWTWNASRAPGSKDRMYGGAHPHDDHLHVEVSSAASQNDSPWFDDQVVPPVLEGCETIGSLGTILDEVDACFQAFGPAEFWRSVQGEGYDDALLWTNVFEASEPSNWARYDLTFDGAYGFSVEAYIESAHAVYDRARYSVRHAGEESIVYIDQSAASGWTPLGDFSFAEGGDQWVAVFDDVDAPVPEGQSIVVDAIRLVPVGAPIPGDGDDGGSQRLPDGGAWPAPGGAGSAGESSGGAFHGNRTRVEEREAGCSCRAGSGRARVPRAGFLLLILGWFRRRPRGEHGSVQSSPD